MLKIIMIIILVLLILIGLTLWGDRIIIINKIKKYFKDFFDVIKYKRRSNAFENKYNSRNEEHVILLEDYHELSVRDMEKDKQIIKLKAEIKELKRIINEDMEPKKKKRSKKSEKN